MKNLKHLLLLTAFVTACSNNQGQQQTEVGNSESTGIVGGSDVKAGDREIRSTVGLYDKKGGFICTGTLISENLVLTAGHCIGEDAKQMFVIFKEKFDDAKPENIRAVVALKRHDDYNTKATRNMADIGLIQFDHKPGLPAGYGAAKLLRDYSQLQPGRSVVAVGYGLNWSWVVKKGSGTLRTTQLKVSDPGFSETEVMIDQSLKKGVCSGDSGGPGYIDIDGQLYIWGVVSRGDSLPIPLTPNCFLFSVYTRVDVYVPWIVKTANEFNGQQQ